MKGSLREIFIIVACHVPVEKNIRSEGRFRMFYYTTKTMNQQHVEEQKTFIENKTLIAFTLHSNYLKQIDFRIKPFSLSLSVFPKQFLFSFFCQQLVLVVVYNATILNPILTEKLSNSTFTTRMLISISCYKIFFQLPLTFYFIKTFHFTPAFFSISIPFFATCQNRTEESNFTFHPMNQREREQKKEGKKTR